jgi:hypothetical protein
MMENIKKALKSVDMSPYTKIAFAIGADAAISEVMEIMMAQTSADVKLAKMKTLHEFINSAGDSASKEIDAIQVLEAAAEEGATIQ